ncbi:Holliday junction resolvase RecU [Metamycoplasma hyosynoviae]|uniref:Holliday junction resolvase RecU n=2 Tax=Metamycoplasma hyosynoviae TaxID=29559 RepID=UPI0023596AE8|nr:Holliday junction resolvase RecU [Metamycoplasma hyosynoviae]MDC8911932.1 Holliday junction resolvase RecU [Metamycoplasma hyosynoviae]MDC8913981.1 Holliday junction resolvase RecU [Metamycoplasma hyosynoviae]MDC8920282.1 Holliday junction resolvase RecU [Metamycoplasma hyosynoviae]MDD1378360.1 Holliday junction resolvase RecU [Metamycoplasma hyosynoviae]
MEKNSKVKQPKNRGMLLEKLINQTNIFYLQNDICIVHKKNLDIKFKSTYVDKDILKTENAHIISKSTVDYYGIYKGKFLAFEAKSTEQKNFSLSNIKMHQINYLSEISKHKGLAFWIFFFKIQNQFVLILHDKLLQWGVYNKKTLGYDEALLLGELIPLIYPGYIDYISILNKNYSL